MLLPINSKRNTERVFDKQSNAYDILVKVTYRLMKPFTLSRPKISYRHHQDAPLRHRHVPCGISTIMNSGSVPPPPERSPHPSSPLSHPISRRATLLWYPLPNRCCRHRNSRYHRGRTGRSPSCGRTHTSSSRILLSRLQSLRLLLVTTST